MNKDKDNYTKYKKYWKLLLKDADKLDGVKLGDHACFRKQMREIDIVDYLINQNDELKDRYLLYQNIKTVLKLKDPKLFESILADPGENISDYMKTSVKTAKKYKHLLSIL